MLWAEMVIRPGYLYRGLQLFVLADVLAPDPVPVRVDEVLACEEDLVVRDGDILEEAPCPQ